MGRTTAQPPLRPTGSQTKAPLSSSEPDRRHPGGDDPSGVLYGRRHTDTSKKRKSQCFVTLCHWSMALLLALNLATGMRLSWANLTSPLGGDHTLWAWVLNTLAPAGDLWGVSVLRIHLTCAWLILITAGIYMAYMVGSGASRRLRLHRRDWRAVARTIWENVFWHNKVALWSANLIVYWLLFVLIILLVLTGVALYRTDWGLYQVVGGYKMALLLHALSAYLLLPSVLLHGLLQWRFGTIRAIVQARFYRPHLKAGLMGMAIVLPIVTGLYVLNDLPMILVAPRLATPGPVPILDGDARDPVWTQAPEVTVSTVKGAIHQTSPVDISVKALHDGQHIYFRLQWADEKASMQSYPLLKTAQGWQVRQTRLAQSDESVYYEDQLALYLTDQPRGSCADTCHLGPDAARNGARVTWGLHYSTGQRGDLWHWQASQTDPMGLGVGEPGYMIDGYLGLLQPLPTRRHQRYRGGYSADPKTSGGARVNFIALASDASGATSYVRPLMVPPAGEGPAEPAAIRSSTLQDIGWIHEAQGVPYTEDRDDYAVGTLLPNVLIAPLQGDQGDVRAKASWHAGRWTLEVRRRLDTQSPYDIAFQPGRPVYLSIAAFNQTQTRHSVHLRPIRLVVY